MVDCLDEDRTVGFNVSGRSTLVAPVRFAIFAAGMIATLVSGCSPASLGGPAPTQALNSRPAVNDDTQFRWDLRNHSDACAWITVYWSYKSQATWHIVGGSSRPRFVARFDSWSGSENYNHPSLGPQIRFRAQVEKSASCGSGTRSNVTADQDVPTYRSTPWVVYLEGSNGKYHIRIKCNLQRGC